MPWFPDPAGGAPIQADTNPNPAGGSYGYYSDPGYSGPPPGGVSGGGGGSSGGGGGGGGGAPPPAGGGNAANLSAENQLMAQAQAAAYQAYLNARLQLDNDTLAFQKAQQAFNETITRAGVTGMYEGAPTQAALQFYANTFGQWGMPGQGQQTLSAQQQAFNQAQAAAQLTGWYQAPQYSPVPPINAPAGAAQMQAGGLSYPPGTVVRTADNQFGVVGPNGTISTGADAQPAIGAAIQAGSGIMTIGNDQFQQALNAGQANAAAAAAAAQAPSGGTPAATGQPGQGPVQTLAGQQQQWSQGFQERSLAADQTQKYLQMMAGLRGPADWIQYQKVLGATPQGLQDLARASAGQYIPGGGATTGVGPNAVTLPGFINSATGGNFAPAQPGYGQWTPQGGDRFAGTSVGPVNWGTPNTANLGAQIQNNPQVQAQQFTKTLVAPNQMAPQTWNAFTPSQQQMLLGTWEAQGYTQDDAKQLFQQSLPKYGGSPTAGAFKLS